MLNLILTVIVAFAAALAAGFIIIPLLRKAKAGQQVRDDGPKSHLKKQGTPTMGGVIILVGIIVATLIFAKGDVTYVLLTILPMIAFAAIGFIDDYIKLFKKRSLGLRAYQKIVLQLVISVLIAVFSYFVVGSELILPFTNEVWDLGWAYIPWTTVVIIAVVNAVNLTDGLDGLASGVTMIDSAAFAFIFIAMAGIVSWDSAVADEGMYTCAVFSLAVAASCLAFLMFNHYPAKVFMGDTGAFALGGAFVMMGILSRMQLMIPIIGIMFVLSAVSVIIQVTSYKTRKKRVFRMAPLHHHFELGGMHETKVVAMYMVITACAAIPSVLIINYLVG